MLNSRKVNLRPIKNTFPSEAIKQKCKEIINLLESKDLHAQDIADKLNISKDITRKYIRYIRENNSKFMKNKKRFIITTSQGYKLTNNKKLIGKWSNQLYKRTTSQTRQLNQVWKIIKENW